MLVTHLSEVAQSKVTGNDLTVQFCLREPWSTTSSVYLTIDLLRKTKFLFKFQLLVTQLHDDADLLGLL